MLDLSIRQRLQSSQVFVQVVVRCDKYFFINSNSLEMLGVLSKGILVCKKKKNPIPLLHTTFYSSAIKWPQKKAQGLVRQYLKHSGHLIELTV
jgi:hypothetical protein